MFVIVTLYIATAPFSNNNCISRKDNSKIKEALFEFIANVEGRI